MAEQAPTFKTKIFDIRDDFDFDIVNFPFLDGAFPRATFYGVYISQLIHFARVSSHVDDFNTRNKVLTAKPLRQRYRYHKLRKALFKIFIGGILIKCLNIMSDEKHFFCEVFLNLNFMATWYIKSVN